jgi:hypothetical protein
MDIETALGMVLAEHKRSQNIYGPYHSLHEAYAVILEEKDELWEEIKKSKQGVLGSEVLHEAIQLASAALHLLTDCFDSHTEKLAYPSISLDFDGVVHAYTSQWTIPEEIRDEPVPGAIEFIRELLVNKVGVAINSVRNQHAMAVAAMVKWLVKNGLNLSEVLEIQFPIFKPKCKVYIDDRAFRFDGTFPKVSDLLGLKTWNEEIRHAKANQLPEQPTQGEQKSC